MSALKNDYINVNKYTRPGTKIASVKGIVIHWTANFGATAKNHETFFGNGGGSRYAGAHIFVDKTEALCIVPLNEVCYHANESTCRVKKLFGKVGSYQGNANVTTIGVEMCVEKDGTIHKDTIDRTVEVVTELCKKYNLDDGDLYRHYDITGKNCPAPWVTKPSEWAKFKDAVQAKLKGKTNTSTASISTITQVSANTSKLAVDGYWGTATTKRLQKVLGVTVDGVLGKNTIRAIQKKVSADPDGILGKETIKGMQKRFKTPQDGIISKPSAMVKAMQRKLNNNKF